MTDWADMSKAETREVERLSARHSDIRIHGSQGFTERQAAKLERKVRLDAFVAKHELGCFKCGSHDGPWASTGFNKRSKPWAICQTCIRTKR